MRTTTVCTHCHLPTITRTATPTLASTTTSNQTFAIRIIWWHYIWSSTHNIFIWIVYKFSYWFIEVLLPLKGEFWGLDPWSLSIRKCCIWQQYSKGHLLCIRVILDKYCARMVSIKPEKQMYIFSDFIKRTSTYRTPEIMNKNGNNWEDWLPPSIFPSYQGIPLQTTYWNGILT